MREESLRIEALEPRHREALLELAREFREEGDDRFAALLHDPEAYLEAVERDRRGVGLPRDRVPQKHFLLYRGERLLGGARLRARLSPPLLLDGGHVGYEIRPSERGRGYAQALLALVLEEARRDGLTRVLLTAALENAASRRVIEKAGGRQDGTSRSPHTGDTMARYWIELA